MFGHEREVDGLRVEGEQLDGIGVLGDHSLDGFACQTVDISEVGDATKERKCSHSS